MGTNYDSNNHQEEGGWTMDSKPGFVSALLLLLVGLAGPGLASPPVPPPTEGFGIATAVDCDMSAGDFTDTEGFTWTWVHDPLSQVLGPFTNGLPYFESTLAYPGSEAHLGATGRAAQIRYTGDMQSTDTSFFQFKQDFTAGSENDPNLAVRKNYGYVASEASLIANAENKERAGLSIVTNGVPTIFVLENGNISVIEPLEDTPTLCPWAQFGWIPATNEFVAMGADTSTTSVMVADTETSVVATRAPEMDHSISAKGAGMAQGLMKASLMEGDGIYFPPPIDTHIGPGGGGLGPPNLHGKTDYSEKTQAAGTIDRFVKEMHYHSTLPDLQMPEPWYLLQ
ncbi:MAG: hypothetical protein SWE60_09440 [Thermodesulfobacteriota bacterium]|nr:hypothetical protein [Thermodesulfobacteriota bacterium]